MTTGESRESSPTSEQEALRRAEEDMAARIARGLAGASREFVIAGNVGADPSGLDAEFYEVEGE